MATRLAQPVTSAGLAPTYHDADVVGDRVPPGCLLHVDNQNAAALTLTIVTPATVDTDLSVADRAVAVPAGTRKLVRVPATKAYVHPDDGLVDLTWSLTGATIKFAVVQ